MTGFAAPVAAVVIPAHDEAAVIGRCLDRLLAGTAPGELDVVVVANGCTDGTAAAARRPGVRVLETPVPGKVHAIGLGDAAVTVFPRVYVDADVDLDAASVRALAAALAEPGVLAAAAAPVFDLDGVGPVARRVHRVHDVLVGPHRALAGAGVYAVNAAGHARAFPLPDVIADDEWVHRSFGPAQRRVAAGARSVVRPARSVRAHLRRRVRVRLGNEQLDRLGQRAPQGRLQPAALRDAVTSRTVSPVDAACYVAVLLADRVLARRQRGRGGSVDWSADTASRTPAEARR